MDRINEALEPIYGWEQQGYSWQDTLGIVSDGLDLSKQEITHIKRYLSQRNSYQKIY